MYSFSGNCADSVQIFHIFMCLWAIYLYITKIGPHISCSRIGISMVGIYKSLTRHITFLGTFVSVFGIGSLQCWTKIKERLHAFPPTTPLPSRSNSKTLPATQRKTDYDRGSLFSPFHVPEKGVDSKPYKTTTKKCGPLLIYIPSTTWTNRWMTICTSNRHRPS